MPCFHPLPVWLKRDVNPATGKRGIAFSLKDGYKDKPLSVPCGTCVGCRERRARLWSVRCLHESKMYNMPGRNCYFITLTYDAGHLPANGSLSKRDWQLFAKRYRERYGPFRFFMCGQYGERTLRPHYHALFFGVEFPDKRLHASNSDKPLWVSKALDECWGLGECKIAPLNMATVHYVTAYMNRSSLDKEMCSRYGLEPEFQLMSRRPGIGKPFIEKFRGDVYPDGFVTLPGGVKQPCPRLYDDYMEEVDPALMERIRLRRLVAMRRDVDGTPRRLITREVIAEARKRFFSGSDPEA